MKNRGVGIVQVQIKAAEAIVGQRVMRVAGQFLEEPLLCFGVAAGFPVDVADRVAQAQCLRPLLQREVVGLQSLFVLRFVLVLLAGQSMDAVGVGVGSDHLLECLLGAEFLNLPKPVQGVGAIRR